MDWDDLRFFLAMTRHRSVRAAGAHLKVSHSTVARRIEQFEERMRVRLFDRTPAGIVPTAAGEELIATAERVEEELNAIERQLVGKDTKLSGEIRVTMPDIVASSLLMDDFVAFCRAYPDIDLVIFTTYELADLSRREADVAIRFLRIGSDPPEHLIGRRMGAPITHAYAAPDYLASVDLEHAPQSARWIGWADHGRFPDWVRESEFPDVPVYGRINDVTMQAEACRRGMGLAMLPCFVGDPDPHLIRVGNRPTGPNYEIWLLSHPDLRETARLRAFREFVATAVERKRDLLQGRGLQPG